jgi:hypothetical protein
MKQKVKQKMKQKVKQKVKQGRCQNSYLSFSKLQRVSKSGSLRGTEVLLSVKTTF